jgi:hypothetical protein
MYDNSNLEVRCRALWAEVLCALESRVCSINDYVRDARTHLECQMINGDAVQIALPTANRSVVAVLDLTDHAIRVNEFVGDTFHNGSSLPLSLLGDGNVYVTAGQSLMGNAMAVARQLMAVLLPDVEKEVSEAHVDQYRSWAAAIITERAKRIAIRVPIEIQTENAIHPASTLDMSELGVKIQSAAQLDRGNYVTIFRGTLGSFFRVVWAKKNDEGTCAGLVCLNPPVEWAEQAV